MQMIDVVLAVILLGRNLVPSKEGELKTFLGICSIVYVRN